MKTIVTKSNEWPTKRGICKKPVNGHDETRGSMLTQDAAQTHRTCFPSLPSEPSLLLSVEAQMARRAYMMHIAIPDILCSSEGMACGRAAVTGGSGRLYVMILWTAKCLTATGRPNMLIGSKLHTTNKLASPVERASHRKISAKMIT